MGAVLLLDWETIAHSWCRLGEVPPADFDALRDALANESRALTGADWTAVMIASVDDEPSTALGGWRAKVLESPHIQDAQYLEMVRAMRQGLYLQDPMTLRIFVGLGKHRVIRRVPGPAAGEMRAKLDGWGVRDQMIGIVALGPAVELYLFTTRLGGRFPFGEGEEAALAAWLPGACTTARHFVRSHGLLGPVALSPRQRQVVAHLLRGRSEKELAGDLGITAATAHEHLMDAYRKLGVRSRTELVALWLHRDR